MKLFLSLAFGVSLIAYNSTETVPRHNVFFAYNSAELSGSPARVVEAVYAKLPAGQQLRFGITGPISNVHGLAEKNRITAARAHSIVMLLKRIGKEGDVVEIKDVTNPYHPKDVDMAASVPFELEVLLTKAGGWKEPKFTSIDDYLPIPVQTFQIDPRKDNRLVGEKGTVLNIPANTLALGNNSVPSTMTVELKEVYGGGSIVNANLHTASGGRMLETGGTIHLNAHCNGSKAKVATGEKIDLEFPNGGAEKTEGMQLFNGRADRKGNFDWVPKVTRNVVSESRSREEFYVNDVQVSKEEYERTIREWEERKLAREQAAKERELELARQAEEHAKQLEKEKSSQDAEVGLNAYLMSTSELGWINCDRFYDVEEKTDIIVMVDTALRPSVRMVFTDIKSVLNGQYDASVGGVRFSGIPVGKTVQLVGYSIKNDVPYMANTKVMVSSDLKKDLNLMQTTKKQMELELAALN